MPSPAIRASRAAFCSTVILGCADANPPTQPVERGGVRTSPAVVSADVSVTPAALPSSVSACYKVGKGEVYLIKTGDTPAACDKKDVEFSLVSQPTSRAIAGMTFHAADVTLAADGRYRALCEAGKSVVTFGWEIPINSTATSSQIRGSRPATNGDQVFWGFQAAAGTQYVFYWTCADADPLPPT